MSSGDSDQCKALTKSGEQCSRPARESGFCHQHGPDDETINESESGEPVSSESTETKETETMSENSVDESDIQAVREQVQNTAEEIVGHRLDGIPSIHRDEENWRVAVEVIERKSVPDTQDILGRYEILLDDDLTVNNYERTHRYRRDDMEHNV